MSIVNINQYQRISDDDRRRNRNTLNEKIKKIATVSKAYFQKIHRSYQDVSNKIQSESAKLWTFVRSNYISIVSIFIIYLFMLLVLLAKIHLHCHAYAIFLSLIGSLGAATWTVFATNKIGLSTILKKVSSTLAMLAIFRKIIEYFTSRPPNDNDQQRLNQQQQQQMFLQQQALELEKQKQELAINNNSAINHDLNPAISSKSISQQPVVVVPSSHVNNNQSVDQPLSDNKNESVKKNFEDDLLEQELRRNLAELDNLKEDKPQENPQATDLSTVANNPAMEHSRGFSANNQNEKEPFGSPNPFSSINEIPPPRIIVVPSPDQPLHGINRSPAPTSNNEEKSVEDLSSSSCSSLHSSLHSINAEEQEKIKSSANRLYSICLEMVSDPLLEEILLDQMTTYCDQQTITDLKNNENPASIPDSIKKSFITSVTNKLRQDVTQEDYDTIIRHYENYKVATEIFDCCDELLNKEGLKEIVATDSALQAFKKQFPTNGAILQEIQLMQQCCNEENGVKQLWIKDKIDQSSKKLTLNLTTIKNFHNQYGAVATMAQQVNHILKQQGVPTKISDPLSKVAPFRIGSDRPHWSFAITSDLIIEHLLVSPEYHNNCQRLIDEYHNMIFDKMCTIYQEAVTNSHLQTIINDGSNQLKIPNFQDITSIKKNIEVYEALIATHDGYKKKEQIAISMCDIENKMQQDKRLRNIVCSFLTPAELSILLKDNQPTVITIENLIDKMGDKNIFDRCQQFVEIVKKWEKRPTILQELSYIAPKVMQVNDQTSHQIIISLLTDDEGFFDSNQLGEPKLRAFRFMQYLNQEQLAHFKENFPTKFINLIYRNDNEEYKKLLQPQDNIKSNLNQVAQEKSPAKRLVKPSTDYLPAHYTTTQKEECLEALLHINHAKPTNWLQPLYFILNNSADGLNRLSDWLKLSEEQIRFICAKKTGFTPGEIRNAKM